MRSAKPKLRPEFSVRSVSFRGATVRSSKSMWNLMQLGVNWLADTRCLAQDDIVFSHYGYYFMFREDLSGRIVKFPDGKVRKLHPIPEIYACS